MQSESSGVPPRSRRFRRLLVVASVMGAAGCGDLYSAQPLPLREYAEITVTPACVPADGQPWVLDAVVSGPKAAFVHDATWVGEGEDLTLDVHHVPCAALLAGVSDPSDDPATGEGLSLCLVAVAEPGAARGERAFTLFVEDGGGTVVVNGALTIQKSCEAP
jgi:hypothetical protein